VRAVNFLRIIGLAAALAAYSLWLLGSRPAAGERSLAAPAATDGLPLLTLDEALDLHKEPRTVFLDVRPAEDYRVGHITGAVSLPGDDAGRLAGLLPALRRAPAVVVYCSSRDCGKSLWVALRLRNAGLTHTWIFPGGWNEWVNAGGPAGRGG
jgi:rhodanese-related sulfurtransferase